MGNILTELPFLKLEDILARAEQGEELNPREMSNMLSRTFGPNIDLLMFARGRGESEDIFRYVTNLNNNARFADCIEDGKLEKPAKLDAFLKLQHLYNRIDLAEVDVEDLIRKDLEEIANEALKGALNRKEELFITQFKKGKTLRDLRSFKPSIKNTIAPMCLSKMITGMGFYVNKGKLSTLDELKDYCFFVAGTVGDALNRIVQIEHGRNVLNFNNARNMGAYVQITNIIKNLEEDKNLKEYRIKFIPDELHEGISYDQLFNEKTENAIKMRTKVLDDMLSFAEAHFLPASQYVIDVPRRLPGYAAFNDVALLLAKETQKHIKNSGAERVFLGEESAIKAGKPTLQNVISFVYRGVKTDDGIKLINFLNDYRKNPDSFPFSDQEMYDRWSKDYFTKVVNGLSPGDP